MDKKTFFIGIFSITAVILFVANFFSTPAVAEQVIKDRDYQMITARVQATGDGLYIVDNRTGKMAIFTYDPTSRTIKVRAIREVADAFVAR